MHTGPRGGKYILINGKKRYVTPGKNTGNRNVLGRAVYKGSHGKLFVITSGGGRSYKFIISTLAPPIRNYNNTVPRRALLIAQGSPRIIIKRNRNLSTMSRRSHLLRM